MARMNARMVTNEHDILPKRPTSERDRFNGLGFGEPVASTAGQNRLRTRIDP